MIRAHKCIEAKVREREVNDVLATRKEIDTDLEGEQAERALALINEYRDLIARNMAQLGCSNALEMNIETEDGKTVCYRPYRLSYSEREQTKYLIKEMKEAGIVEDSCSPYASPMLLVRKASGEIRMCVDFRALNKLTVKDHYPLPRVDDILDRLGGKKYFTTLDLASGYYQIPVAKDSRPKTAFVTPDDHCQFKRMPMGLCNAPAIFQRLMCRVFSTLQPETVQIYIDDAIIPSENFEAGLENLRKVFDALRAANLSIKLEKCHFFKRKVEYLGFMLSDGEISPGTKILRAVKDFPRPTNVGGVRSFVGTATFCRRFIKNFSLIAKPLTDLTAKNAKFLWGPDQQRAFDILKQRLIEKPVLAIYRPGVETEVHTDASQIGLGAVLLQRQDDGKLHPVCYYSRKTSKDEAKYHSYELEALAIVCALERFRVYLIGIVFVIRTDCNSLKLLESKRDLSARIGRWFVRLAEFNYRIEYFKGVRNVVADGLSRNPVEPAEELGLVGLPVMGLRITTDWVAAMQRGSEEIVPVDLRHELVSEAHRGLAHLGVDKTLGKLKENYYFPKMRDFVNEHIRRCINCLYYKTPSGKKPGYLHPLEKGTTPFQCVHVDHAGPYVVSERGNKYVGAIVCGYSKYTVLKAVRDQSAVGAAQMMREFIAHYGKPERIISDRGSAFTAAEFEQFCEEYEIQHVKIASGVPRANGQVERTNRVLSTCLASITDSDENRDWDDKLWDVQWAINNCEHKVTKRTPYEVVFKNQAPGLFDNPLTREVMKLNREKAVEEPKEDIAELLKANAVAMKERYDKKRKAPRQYEVGDLVMILSDSPSTGESRKLEPKKRGPYEITKVLRNDRYAVEDIEGEKQSNKRYQGVISVDRLEWIPKQSS